jgi:hypothetical protein
MKIFLIGSNQMEIIRHEAPGIQNQAFLYLTIDYGVEESGLHFYGLTFDTPQEMDWKSTSLRWTDAATLLIDYSFLDGPRVYYKRVQQQDTEK